LLKLIIDKRRIQLPFFGLKRIKLFFKRLSEDTSYRGQRPRQRRRCRGRTRRRIRFDHIRDFAERCIKVFDVRCPGPAAAAGSLSGGNLQKFIIGREILQDPGVFIVSQPTWGVDVGVALVIRQAILDLRERGAAIVVISEELDELFDIADRIAVIAGGQLTDALPVVEADRNDIGLAMSGSKRELEITDAL
jgi:general nucleoside transport system ATP-binding protein